MALVINSNIMSMNAQRNITSAQSEQNQAMERLTSGKRINSAADDAAGLAISNRMTSQIKGLDQAIRNANDGISMIQTAEGALDESTNILQRMRELSVQSANGSYDEGNRNTLNAEVQQLVKELDRIAETTSFNGQNVLDGSLGTVDLQVGSESNQTISFKLESMDSKNLGLGTTSADITGDRISTGSGVNVAEGGIEINGQALGAITNLGHTGASDTQLKDVLDDINNNIEGVKATAYNNVQADTAGTGVLSSSETLRITLGAVDGGADVNYDISDTDNMEELVDKINSTTGGTVKADLDDNGRLQLSNSTGGTITVAYDNASPFSAAHASTDLNDITGIADASSDGTESFTGSIALESENGDPITVTAGATGSDADLEELGFRSIQAAGVVVGEELDNSEQTTVMVANDVKINGVAISSTAADGSTVNSLSEKVANINAVSDETNVTASVVAEASYAFSGSDTSGTALKVVELTSTATSASTPFTAGTFDINGTAVATLTTDTFETLAVKINAETAKTGVTAHVNDAGNMVLFAEGPVKLTEGSTASGFAATFGGGITAGDHATAAVTSGSININNQEVALTDLTDLDQVVTDLNAQQGNTGVSASIDDNGQLQLNSTAQISLKVGQTSGLSSAEALGIDFGVPGADSSYSDDDKKVGARIKLDSDNDQNISVEVTKNGADATGLSNMNSADGVGSTGSALANIDISTAAGAQKAIDSIDNALEKVNETRSELGAVNNRLDFTINNLSNVSENASAARSRIEDADFAKESANLSRAQVLQQAGSAMLAQANAAPQQVLSLLQ